MLAYGAQSAAGEGIDPKPVVKLFTPDGACTWLKGKLGLSVERDLYFRPDKPLSAYADEATKHRVIRA
jgi:hypothetical protein